MVGKKEDTRDREKDVVGEGDKMERATEKTQLRLNV